jgi:hypothetical protein
MDLRALARRVALGLAGTALSVAVLALAAHAEGPAGLVVHDASETLRDYCTFDASGAAWLHLPGRGTFELMTSTFEGGLTSGGDGTFHPFDGAEVRAALAAVRFPLGGAPAEIFILPYPRRDGVESAAAPGLVFLSPGIRPIPVEQQHATVVHELGHVVQHALMPESDGDAWSRYRALRGITDETRYHAGAAHADRPREIFAEDFRALFGGALATSSGTIENATLTPPMLVPGLDAFLLSLTAGAPPARLAAWPSPGQGAVTFARAGGPAAALDLFDVSGRRIATLEPRPAAHGWTWWWAGEDRGAGVVFARERGAGGASVRVIRAR